MTDKQYLLALTVISISDGWYSNQTMFIGVLLQLRSLRSPIQCVSETPSPVDLAVVIDVALGRYDGISAA